MTRTTQFLLLAAMPTLAACPTKNTQDLGAWLLCTATETAFGFDETTPIGLSGADILAALEGSHEASGVYSNSDGETTTVTLSIETSATEITFIDQEPNTSDTGTSSLLAGDTGDTTSDCPDYVQVAVTTSISTADAQFAESFAATLRQNELGVAEFSGEFDPTELQGTFSPTVAASESATIIVTHTFGDTPSGAIDLELEGDDTSGGADGVAWHSIQTILSWPDESEEAEE